MVPEDLISYRTEEYRKNITNRNYVTSNWKKIESVTTVCLNSNGYATLYDVSELGKLLDEFVYTGTF